jgi:hypothetical protein
MTCRFWCLYSYLVHGVNIGKNKTVLDCFSFHREARNLTLVRKLDIARTFYRGVVGAVLTSGATPTPHTTGRSLLTSPVANSWQNFPALAGKIRPPGDLFF